MTTKARFVTASQRAQFILCAQSNENKQFAVYRLPSTTELFMNCERRGRKREEPNLSYYMFKFGESENSYSICNRIIEMGVLYTVHCHVYDTCSEFHAVNCKTKSIHFTRLV
jgi:hypothetical protein